MSAGTAARAGATFAVPTVEGLLDVVEGLKAAADSGKWTLIAPDGRVWMNDDPRLIGAVLMAILGGEALLFDPSKMKVMP